MSHAASRSADLSVQRGFWGLHKLVFSGSASQSCKIPGGRKKQNPANTNQPSALPRILPTNHCSATHPESSQIHMENCSDSGSDMPLSWPCCCLRKRSLATCTTTFARTMGEFVGNYGNRAGSDTIHTPDMDDLASRPCRKSKHTHDAHPNTWQLRLVLELVGEVRPGRLEYLGRIPGHGQPTRLSFDHGNLFRGQSQACKGGFGF